MQTSEEAGRLSQIIDQKVEEFKGLTQGLDEETASRAPAGRWSPKQIVSHLCGPEGRGFLPSIVAIVEQDTPRIDIDPENPFFTEKRSRMTLSELLAEFESEYRRIAEFTTGLSEEQLGRKAHIPLLKETPMSEYPTCAAWIAAIGEHHLGMHIDHMREILQGLGVSAGSHKK
ncbi:MAG: DinB family protein [Desulfomonile tiedjei]|nr:DinB family protein [Desulfomonile tiedjei]